MAYESGRCTKLRLLVGFRRQYEYAIHRRRVLEDREQK